MQTNLWEMTDKIYFFYFRNKSVSFNKCIELRQREREKKEFFDI